MQEAISNSNQWSDCLNYLSRRVKEQTFRTWLKPTVGEPGTNGDFKVGVPNQFVADWIRDHFQDMIDEALFEVSGKKYDLVYVIKKSDDDPHQRSLELYQSSIEKTAQTVRQPVRQTDHNLNEKYNFETLVVGDFNQFACAAAVAVAACPRARRSRARDASGYRGAHDPGERTRCGGHAGARRARTAADRRRARRPEPRRRGPSPARARGWPRSGSGAGARGACARGS